MSRKPTLPPHAKNTEDIELYEQVETVHSSRAQRQEKRYVEATSQIMQPSPHTGLASVSMAAVAKDKKPKTIFIVLGVVFLLCLLVVCLVAVVLYSPGLRTPTGETATTSAQTMEALLHRIEQLESRVKQLQTIQGTNYTVDTLTYLQETQESVEVSISRLSAFERSASSQLITVQNLIQSQSSVQNNLRQDLDRLRSVDLSQSCIKLTRSCTMSSSGGNYYWRSCSTSNRNINSADTQYYYEDMRCEYQSAYGYIESSVLRKNGDNYYCWCDVTSLSSSSHSYLSTSFSATCTLTVTRCPRSVNLLS